MIYIIIVAVGILGVLLLGGKAFSGPNPRRSLKRNVSPPTVCNSTSGASANADLSAGGAVGAV